MSDWADYDSGPFCRHWGDPSDCEEKCGSCGHGCAWHWYDGNACHNLFCICTSWIDKN